MCQVNKIPKGLAKIHVELHYIPKGAYGQDSDMGTATLKAVRDAIAYGKGVKKGYGVVPDDTPNYMTSEFILEPVVKVTKRTRAFEEGNGLDHRVYIIIKEISDDSTST